METRKQIAVAKNYLTALFFLVTLSLSAQSNTEGEAFHLTKQGAHYVFND